MGALIDPRPLARTVTIIVWAWIGAQALYMLAVVAGLLRAGHQDTELAAPLAALLLFAAHLAAIVAVARWIWRTNKNAHGLASGMSVTPGWAVGWFFIPIANLFKPFGGVRETWQVSHDPEHWSAVPTPPLLRWWWGLWLASNMLANLAFQLSRKGLLAEESLLDVIEGAVAIGAGVALLRVIRRLSAAQSQSIAAQAFA